MLTMGRVNDPSVKNGVVAELGLRPEGVQRTAVLGAAWSQFDLPGRPPTWARYMRTTQRLAFNPLRARGRRARAGRPRRPGAPSLSWAGALRRARRDRPRPAQPADRLAATGAQRHRQVETRTSTLLCPQSCALVRWGTSAPSKRWAGAVGGSIAQALGRERPRRCRRLDHGNCAYPVGATSGDLQRDVGQVGFSGGTM